VINDAIIGIAIICAGAFTYLMLAKWLEDRQIARLKAQREEFMRRERAELAKQGKALEKPLDWPKQDDFDWRNYTDTGKLEVRHETYKGE